MDWLTLLVVAAAILLGYWLRGFDVPRDAETLAAKGARSAASSSSAASASSAASSSAATSPGGPASPSASPSHGRPTVSAAAAGSGPTLSLQSPSGGSSSSAFPASPLPSTRNINPGSARGKAAQASKADAAAKSALTFPPPLTAEALAAWSLKRRVIIVAKQLPVSVRRDPTKPGGWAVEWDDHRNFIANLRVLKTKLGVDVKWVGAVADVPRDEEDEVEEVLAEHDCVPVFMDKALSRRFYTGFCKGVLWPLLHYVVPSNAESWGAKWDDWWQAYNAANTKYATVVARAAESQEDYVWIHNYHLWLLPSFVRARMHHARIGLFIHTPFPSSDVFRMLPTRYNLLAAMMACDMLGFHTFDYARHFLSAIKRVMDLDYETLPGGMLGIKYSGRFVALLISHVGVDAQFFNEVSKDEKTLRRAEELRSQTGGRSIVLVVEELDSIKAPLLKLNAFERFLEKYGTEWAEKVVLVEMIPPAGTSEEVLAVKSQLVAKLQSIQKTYGPKVVHLIDYGEQKMSNADMVNDMVAAYRAATVGLIATFWDGLNMTPYEFTAAQDPNQPGSLIVSEFMGCSRSLNGVLRVNPWALESVSEALLQAVSAIEDERRANHHRRFNYVMNHTVERWAVGFLQHLDRASQSCSSLNYVQVGFGSNVRLLGVRSDFKHLDEGALTMEYRQSSRRVLLLDYDGTLTSAEKSSQRSKFNRPSAEVMGLLRTLCADKDNFVFIMSGRTRDTLGEWFHEIKELGLTAEKGLFIKWPERMTEMRKEMLAEKDRIAPSPPRISDEDDAAAAEAKSAAGADGGTGDEHIEAEEEMEWEATIDLPEQQVWKDVALETIKAYTEMTDGSWIEDKEYAIVWHYEQADPEYGRMQASELEKYLVRVLNTTNIDVIKYDYNRILEVKPHGVNKGIAASAILEAVQAMISKQVAEGIDPYSPRQGALASPNNQPMASPTAGVIVRRPSMTSLVSGPLGSPSSVLPLHAEASLPLFIFAAGDDRSDEDMFLAVQNRDELRRRKAEQQKQELSAGIKKKVLSSKNLAGMDDGVAPTSVLQSPTAQSQAATAAASPSWEELPRRSAEPNVFTVCVGMKPSNAHYYLHDDEEVIKALQGMAMASRLIHNTTTPRFHQAAPMDQKMPTLSSKGVMIGNQRSPGDQNKRSPSYSPQMMSQYGASPPFTLGPAPITQALQQQQQQQAQGRGALGKKKAASVSLASLGR